MQQDTLLFRQEAIDAQKTPSLGTIRLATPVSHQMWTLAATGIAIATLAWLFVGQYTRREHVAGTLVPQAGLLTLTARNAGTVTSVPVAEGMNVHAGDALLTVSDDRSSASMGDTSAVISAQLRQQQARLQADLADARHLADEQADDLRMQQRMQTDQLQQVDAQLVIEKRQVGGLSALLHRLQALGTKGYVSALDIQQQRTQELDAEEQVKSLARQRSESEQQLKSVADQLMQLPLTTAAKLNDLRNQLAQNRQSLAQSETDRATVVRAPKDGLVSSVLIQLCDKKIMRNEKKIKKQKINIAWATSSAIFTFAIIYTFYIAKIMHTANGDVPSWQAMALFDLVVTALLRIAIKSRFK